MDINEKQMVVKENFAMYANSPTSELFNEKVVKRKSRKLLIERNHSFPNVPKLVIQNITIT